MPCGLAVSCYATIPTCRQIYTFCFAPLLYCVPLRYCIAGSGCTHIASVRLMRWWARTWQLKASTGAGAMPLAGHSGHRDARAPCASCACDSSLSSFCSCRLKAFLPLCFTPNTKPFLIPGLQSAIPQNKMSQRKSKSSPSNGSSDQVMEASKAAALQQYMETEGHFSLVRSV